VNERPVKLIVNDDLRRGHGSVFFRWWLALPLFLWLALWTFAAFFVAIANWLATLVQGRAPESLHEFLARYVRFTTHVYAYLNLAAEPLPNFDGKPGYAIDVHIDPPATQNRWTVAFRIVLAIPVLLLASALLGSSLYVLQGHLNYGSFGLMSTCAFLAWFVGVAQGRTPRGLRDTAAFALSYGAQAWAYLLLLTDRYPSSDPLQAIGPLPTRADPVTLSITGELRRSRLTTFFRVLLALPHLVWLALWSVVSYLVAIVNGIVVLISGSSAASLHRFLAAFVRYQTHVFAYLLLTANPFPGFVGKADSYRVEVLIEAPRRQNRWTAFFRIILVIPALMLAGAYGAVLYVAGILGWFAALFTAKMPLGLRNVQALALRYTAQTHAYLLLLTDRYPYSGPTALAPAVPEGAVAAYPLPG
jgi:hypothetical protein